MTLSRSAYLKLSLEEQKVYRRKNSTPYPKEYVPEDSSTLEKIWPKLSASQRDWVNSLNNEDKKIIESTLKKSGEAYTLNNWNFFVLSWEYVQTL
jgi:hypothetical protein